MFAAIKANDVDGVRNALEGGANPRATKFGYTAADVALCITRRWGLEPSKPSIEIVGLLMEAGSLPGESRNSIAYNVEITEEWFDLFHRFDVNVDAAVIQLLVERGQFELWDHCKGRIKIETKRTKGSRTPLHTTLLGTRPSWEGRNRYLAPQRVERLLDAGCGIEDREDGDTPLIIAIKVGDTKAVEVLLSRGADVSAKDGSDRTLSEVMEWKNSSPDMRATVDRYLLAKTTDSVMLAATSRRL